MSASHASSSVDTLPAEQPYSYGDWIYLQCDAPPPLREGGHQFYVLVDHSMWKLSQFLKHVPASMQEVSSWKICTQCRSAWPDLSRVGVVDAKGNIQPAYLSGDPCTYGNLESAVAAFQEAFRAGHVDRSVMFEQPTTERHAATTLGHKTAGIRPEGIPGAGLPYIHMCMNINLPENPRSEKLNALLLTEVPLVEQFSNSWTRAVVDKILVWYETKGHDAPGYKVNIGGLRWFSGLLKDIEMHGAGKIQTRRVLIIRHLLRLLSGPRPDDALGGVHIFASGSNLATCRDASSVEAFWKIMDARYNPITYRQPTAAPTAGQVEAALKEVDGDTTGYERESLAAADPMVTSRALWMESEAPPAHDATRISADALRAAARPKKTSVPTTCFDHEVVVKGETRKLNLSPDEFENWLSEQPAGSKLMWNLPSTVIPIVVGVPTTGKGREMVKVPANWVVPGSHRTASSVGLLSTWEPVESIVHHPGRWLHDGGLSDRAHAVVSDGIVVVTKTRPTYTPNCSCLFAEFFRGEFHGSGKVRQALHNTLRIRRPDGMTLPKMFQGCIIQIRLKGTRWSVDAPTSFRVLRPDGTQQTVTIN
jgi:hypothetical protein